MHIFDETLIQLICLAIFFKSNPMPLSRKKTKPLKDDLQSVFLPRIHVLTLHIIKWPWHFWLYTFSRQY